MKNQETTLNRANTVTNAGQNAINSKVSDTLATPGTNKPTPQTPETPVTPTNAELVKLINVKSELGVAAAIEARRLAEKYGKDFFDCEDLVEVTGFGRNNVRQLLNSDSFPTITVGNRKAVSVIAYVLWTLKNLSV